MKIMLTSSGRDLDAPLSPAFGRCPWFLVVSDENDHVTALENPAADAAGGAGVKASQLVARRGIGAVVTGRVGPHALDVLSAAGIRVYDFEDRDARSALEDCRKGLLPAIENAAPPLGGRGGGRGRGGGGGGDGGRGGGRGS